MELAIFGAQATALGAYEAIRKLYPLRGIRYFIVTQIGANPDSLSGIPVVELNILSEDMSQAEKENLEVLIATPENVMPEIEESLEYYGFFCHVRLTSERFGILQSFSCVCDHNFMPLSALPVGYHRGELHVFMAKYHKDKKLKETYEKPDWITPIQVGACLCRERVAPA